MISNIKKILIINPGALGDYIAASVPINKLRKSYPNAHITVLATEYIKNVMPEGSIIDEIINYDNYKKIGGLFKLLVVLRKSKYDVVINLRWHSEKDLFIAAFSGARFTMGMSKGILSVLYSYSIKNNKEVQHEFHRKLSIIKSINKIDDLPEPYVHISNDSLLFATNFFKENGINVDSTIILSPFASNINKSWKVENFILLSKKIISILGFKIVITYGPADLQLAEKFVKSVGNGCYLAPKTNITQLAAFVKLSKLCICNNSGVMNIAMAVSSPCIVLSCTLSKLWGALGVNDVNIEPKGLQQYYETQNYRNIDDRLVKQMLDDIDVKVVFEVVSKKLKELNI